MALADLRLSNGDRLQGELIGAPIRASGELVFTTGMVGYCEAMSDPSYLGQILVFAYPLIGNYGVPSIGRHPDMPVPKGIESSGIHASAVIVGSSPPYPDHWSSQASLSDWLVQHNVPGIVGVDTRHLVQIIRQTPNLMGIVEPHGYTETKMIAGMSGHVDWSGFFNPGEHLVLPAVSTSRRQAIGDGALKIAIVDCGVKHNILRMIVGAGFRVEILPWDTDLSGVECDGWIISNGPGDPVQTGDLIKRIRSILDGERPILGICLGHQLISLAAGAVTEKMDYGHRSHNQPVVLCGTNRAFLTSQNHGYVVRRESIPDDWEPWFVNANDDSIEGIRHKSLPIQAVQFHPEAAAGPRDTNWIIHDFLKQVEDRA